MSNPLRPHKLQHPRLFCPSLSPSLLKLMSIQSVMPANHLILCCPLLLLPSIFPSMRVFCSELALPIMWPKYWSVSFNIQYFSVLLSFWKLLELLILSILLHDNFERGQNNSYSGFISTETSNIYCFLPVID